MGRALAESLMTSACTIREKSPGLHDGPARAR
jgi:hypothetical protein